MEISLTPQTVDSTQSPYSAASLNHEKGTIQNSKWSLDESLLLVSEGEMRTHRLGQFNEKFQELLNKEMSQQCRQDASRVKRAQGNVITDPSYIAPHIKVGPGVVRPTVITVGDPFRCEVVAKMCDKKEEVQWNREYRLFNVTFEEAELSIISHGIGGPGAAICFEELVKLGAKTIIRLGTCGGMQEHIKTGDLIVASGACREDGYTEFVAPSGFPAVGDNELTIALYNQAIALNSRVHMGVCLTSGLFYQGCSMPSSLKVNADTGALMVEMEVAALFITGIMRGVRTAAIATADGNVFNQGDYDPHGTIVAEGKNKMLRVGLTVAKKAAEEDKAMNQSIQIFEPQSQMKYLDLFKTSSLYDFVQNQNQISDKHKGAILQLATKGSFANFQFFLDKATKMNEEEIQNAIILFHKVQRGADEGYAAKSKVFLETLAQQEKSF